MDAAAAAMKTLRINTLLSSYRRSTGPVADRSATGETQFDLERAVNDEKLPSADAAMK
jgi:hypothetical protein